MVVEGAGSQEVNGEYKFVDIKSNAGSFRRDGIFQGQPVKFTLYKCSVQNSGFQWFISITPEGHEPGTRHDIDFYYALCKHGHDALLPPTAWGQLNNASTSRLPVPTVKCISPEPPDIAGLNLDSEPHTAPVSWASRPAALAVPAESDSDKEEEPSWAIEEDIGNDESFSSTPSGRDSPTRNGRGGYHPGF